MDILLCITTFGYSVSGLLYVINLKNISEQFDDNMEHGGFQVMHGRLEKDPNDPIFDISLDGDILTDIKSSQCFIQYVELNTEPISESTSTYITTSMNLIRHNDVVKVYLDRTTINRIYGKHDDGRFFDIDTHRYSPSEYDRINKLVGSSLPNRSTTLSNIQVDYAKIPKNNNCYVFGKNVINGLFLYHIGTKTEVLHEFNKIVGYSQYMHGMFVGLTIFTGSCLLLVVTNRVTRQQ